MKRNCHLLRLLVVLSFTLITVLSTLLLAGEKAECEKDCQETYQNCVKMCKQRLKKPMAIAKCKDTGCKMIRDECLKDCKEENP